MTAEFLLLRAIHVVGGIFWTGSALFTGLFLMPSWRGCSAAPA